jgi:hypothetical protein
MSESCFLRCVTTFNSRPLTEEEVIYIFSLVIEHNVEVGVSAKKDKIISVIFRSAELHAALA